MSCCLRNVTVDCTDARALARFWAAVLNWNVYYAEDDAEVVVAASFPARGPEPKMLFIPVPEPRTVKNRLHVDLQPVDCTRDEEVSRLIDLGATLVEDHRNDDGTGWVWLADPEGNDFCVERGVSERTTKPRSFRLVEDS